MTVREETLKKNLQETVAFLQSRLTKANCCPARIGVTLGSGLGSFVDSLTEKLSLPCGDIPHMPVSTVPGHDSHFVYGLTASGVPVLVAQGRVHFYEGHSLDAITYAVRVMHALGVRHYCPTNAAGSVNPKFSQGDFMLITDHINLVQVSPLTGIVDPELGERFASLTHVYDAACAERFLQGLRTQGFPVPVHTGVYAWSIGPHYETPAEVRMLRILGIDAVGMSTVPEVIVAASLGMKVNGLSLITNLGSGMAPAGKKALDLYHAHVKDVAAGRARELATVLTSLVDVISQM